MFTNTCEEEWGLLWFCYMRRLYAFFAPLEIFKCLFIEIASIAYFFLVIYLHA